jgi:hypothetical protein
MPQRADHGRAITSYGRRDRVAPPPGRMTFSAQAGLFLCHAWPCIRLRERVAAGPAPSQPAGTSSASATPRPSPAGAAVLLRCLCRTVSVASL